MQHIKRFSQVNEDHTPGILRFDQFINEAELTLHYTDRVDLRGKIYV